MSPLVFFLQIEFQYACGERDEVWLGFCGKIGEGLFEYIIWYRGGMFGHYAWRHNSIPGQGLQFFFLSNLLIFHNIFGGIGAGGRHVFSPHIQLQSHQQLSKIGWGARCVFIALGLLQPQITLICWGMCILNCWLTFHFGVGHSTPWKFQNLPIHYEQMFAGYIIQ